MAVGDTGPQSFIKSPFADSRLSAAPSCCYCLERVRPHRCRFRAYACKISTPYKIPQPTISNLLCQGLPGLVVRPYKRMGCKIWPEGGSTTPHATREHREQGRSCLAAWRAREPRRDLIVVHVIANPLPEPRNGLICLGVKGVRTTPKASTRISTNNITHDLRRGTSFCQQMTVCRMSFVV